MTINVNMESPRVGRTIIHIRQTTLKHRHITNYLLALHSLTGSNTVSYLFGIAKVTALTVLRSGHHIIELDRHGAYADRLIYEATTFDAACYGSNIDGYMTTHSYQMWRYKIVYPIQYGWHSSNDVTPLYATTRSADVSAAPLTILHLIKCGCSTSRPCSTGRCGYLAALVSCSMLHQTVVTNRTVAANSPFLGSKPRVISGRSGQFPVCLATHSTPAKAAVHSPLA